ncbi:hypothetical protein PYCCODRAFT_752244 [Trametes coccinea BRFM310]|uniref:Uncharacterized protein n=1 Tax=Trametes coccinea (strain BRFM310) TaxID=1353009 RepID=A0A1Y2IFF6_TRAC3|nr:hypothetical protein PYCCODRAFT_752244 [Trametes coccinea BRFM310]
MHKCSPTLPDVPRKPVATFATTIACMRSDKIKKGQWGPLDSAQDCLDGARPTSSAPDDAPASPSAHLQTAIVCARTKRPSRCGLGRLLAALLFDDPFDCLPTNAGQPGPLMMNISLVTCEYKFHNVWVELHRRRTDTHVKRQSCGIKSNSVRSVHTTKPCTRSLLLKRFYWPRVQNPARWQT